MYLLNMIIITLHHLTGEELEKAFSLRPVVAQGHKV